MTISKRNALDMWNEQFSQFKEKGIQYFEPNSWLKSYLPILHDRGFNQVLEIGCGSGNDTRFLVGNGFKVTATDFSEVALSIVESNIPTVQILHHDTQNKFPFEDGGFEFIVASLSLHYFDVSLFKQILGEVRRMLSDKGLFLIRLNSVNDEDAQKVHVIDRYFYSIDSCRELFEGWKEIELGEHAIDYYGKEKIVIEGCFER
ncbi:class I SAM-dependent methyltransferase [Paenibacillus alba]|uniref:Class I SAM-dependent methyltransferase n=1 Tax=Paenibacillus alba TaxID=1197127 RepID=A0ABU6FW01_9BACL|nr:class I SAM-dependent methyltransferase [Paenibacillus alba]MEC0225901.1 class I SAM-dependent methyltransferase [Paenibacillus alba]